ncbi:ankyrin repeat domain-containing protein [Polaribacter sp. Asnod6-C07]|uniref:ankyrin repeat domain-containing protein n=1 Tax=Polaribacter sp. Asnod6-C07 TaxID=3160582 RepID=UPI00386D137F
MKKSQKISIILFLISIGTFAQQKNIFHDRGFWKSKPTIEIIEQKIATGIDIEKSNSNAFDATVYAILEKSDDKIIEYIISKNGNNVNKLTHDGRTYLHWAAYSGKLEIMKYLISKGAKTDVVDTHGNTFLNFAASSGQGNLEIYKYGIEIGADITKEKNHDGANALLLVASNVKDFKIIDLFVANGASLNDKDDNGNGFFEYAAKGGNTKFLSTLIDKGIDTGKNAMIFASQGSRRKSNTLETYQFLAKKGIKVNAVDHENRNPLHFIARNNKDINIYKFFIDKGVDINLQDYEGNTPFMVSTTSGNLKTIEFLAKDVKNINLKNKKGTTALTNAVGRNSTDVVTFLIEKGADINTLDKDDNTLSYYLINSFGGRNKDAFETKLKVLEKNGLIINKPQNSGNTLLHIAANENNLALLKRLASFNIDVNAKNKEGITALQISAMKAKDDKIIKYLIGIGADKNIKTDFDETVYDLASENELLKKQNVNISFLK